MSANHEGAAAPALLTVVLKDWRIGEGVAVAPQDERPWTVKVREGGYGVVLDLEGPEDRRHSLGIELESGTVVVRVFREDVPDTALSLTATSTIVASPSEAGLLAGRRLVMTDDSAHWGRAPVPVAPSDQG